MRFEPGERFNDFEVIERLGSGAYGTVYSCTWAMDGRAYAVKVFDGSIEAARREFTALQGVRHQNVVGCLYAGSIVGGGWYLQCELVAGQPLSTWVNDGHRFDPEQAVDIALQLLAALEAIHPDVDRITALKAKGALDGFTDDEYAELGHLEQSGLVHRDVKPENVILTEEGHVVLVDFGIASQAGSTMRTASATQEYLPPDFAFLAGDRWRPDLDIYAAGAVIYQLFCGDHPYFGAEYGTDPKPPPADLGAPLAAWLVRACAARQADRFGSAPQMRATLLEAVSAHPESMATADEEVVQQPPEPAPNAFRLASYVAWDVRPATAESDRDLLALVYEIVGVEGPIICGRLYGLVAQAIGSSAEAVRSPMNRLVYNAVRHGRLSQVEPLGQGQIDKTVMLPGLEVVVARELGPRKAWQYPKVEMTELVRSLLTELDQHEDLLADDELTASVVVSMFGVEDESWEARYLEASAREAHANLVEPDRA